MHGHFPAVPAPGCYPYAFNDTIARQSQVLAHTSEDNCALTNNINSLSYRCNQLTCNNVNLQMTVDSLTAENKYLTDRLKTVYYDYDKFLDGAIAHSNQAINSFQAFIGGCMKKKKWIAQGIDGDAMK